jgi:hypothetical protein
MIILYIIIWIVIGLLASLYPLTIEYKRHGRTIYNEDIPFLIVFPIFGPVAVLMIAAGLAGQGEPNWHIDSQDC